MNAAITQSGRNAVAPRDEAERDEAERAAQGDEHRAHRDHRRAPLRSDAVVDRGHENRLAETEGRLLNQDPEKHRRERPRQAQQAAACRLARAPRPNEQGLSREAHEQRRHHVAAGQRREIHERPHPAHDGDALAGEVLRGGFARACESAPRRRRARPRARQSIISSREVRTMAQPSRTVARNCEPGSAELPLRRVAAPSSSARRATPVQHEAHAGDPPSSGGTRPRRRSPTTTPPTIITTRESICARRRSDRSASDCPPRACRLPPRHRGRRRRAWCRSHRSTSATTQSPKVSARA